MENILTRYRRNTTLTNDGRNEIRINNSAGRCMLENWVEERANLGRDPALDREYNMKERAIFLRSGHSGLLTTDDKAKAENLTTVRATYTPPKVDKTRTVGARKEMMEQALSKIACEDMVRDKKEKEIIDRGEPMCSIFMQDYTKDFPRLEPEQTKDHDYVNDQPVTFWSEHKDRMHGMTQTKTRDSAFRRNDAFSKPIGEYWDEPKPTEFDKYPMM
ncbi:sperm-associated antigen 8-like [Physella acuta]|uniref:sperm-associated antigen 8-like n=1 Tax=Physella acuta TaxID=109671 RepID=UPI0027DC0C22|nr:sperm-associated antigen 8-like [Physella acuta]